MKTGELIGWLFLSIVKFFFTPSLMIGAGNNFLSSWIISSIGASLGFVFFYYLGHYLFGYFNKNRKRKNPTKKKIKRLRFIMKRGPIGLFILTPILSVPIVAIIASRFFAHHKVIVPKFILGFFIWALILTSFSYLVKTNI